MSLIEYFKLIPEFNRISTDDKIRLIRNNFGVTISLNESTGVPEDREILSTTLKNVFGFQLSVYVYRSIELLQAYVHDPMLIKLILIVECLSSSITRYCNERDINRIYDDSKIIFSAQNIYTELLWRYIVSRSPSEQVAVKFFSKIIQNLLVIVNISFMIDTFVYCFAGEIEKLEPLVQSILPGLKETMQINNYDIDVESVCYTKYTS